MLSLIFQGIKLFFCLSLFLILLKDVILSPVFNNFILFDVTVCFCFFYLLIYIFKTKKGLNKEQRMIIYENMLISLGNLGKPFLTWKTNPKNHIQELHDKKCKY